MVFINAHTHRHTHTHIYIYIYIYIYTHTHTKYIGHWLKTCPKEEIITRKLM